MGFVLVPPVRRVIDIKQDALSVFSLVTGLFVGGLATGISLGALGGIVGLIDFRIRLVVALAVGLALVLGEFGDQIQKLPSRKILVDESLFHESRGIGSLAFGFELGLGFRTVVTHAGPLALALFLLLGRPNVAQVLFLSLGWALGRSTSVVARLAASYATHGDLRTERTSPDDLIVRVLGGLVGRPRFVGIGSTALAVFLVGVSTPAVTGL